MHEPVLLAEVVAAVPQTSRRIIDATLGLGGHAAALLTKAGDAQLLGLDVDERSLVMAKERLAPFADRINLMVANFRDLAAAATDIGWDWADVILFDLGVSSLELGDARLGLSFRQRGPLDMRLSPDLPLTAADIVNRWSQAALVKLLVELGEEPHARRIARAIVEARQQSPITDTLTLASIVERALARPAKWGRGRKVHVATNTFRALRMAVNDELGALREALPQASRLLVPGGLLLVISFHSLEDRIVKTFMKGDPTLEPVTAKPIVPQPDEIAKNPRARSAKLRIARKTPTPTAYQTECC